MLLVPRVQKALGKVSSHKVHVPRRFTGHALGLDRVVQEIGLDTARARHMRATGATHGLAGLLKGVGTDGAAVGHVVCWGSWSSAVKKI